MWFAANKEKWMNVQVADWIYLTLNKLIRFSNKNLAVQIFRFFFKALVNLFMEKTKDASY